MDKLIVGLAAFGLLITSTSAVSAPCRDAKGKFVKCPTVAAKTVRCKDSKGKFAKCGTPGARPVK